MRRKVIWEVEQCGGMDLERALLDAAETVKRLGEENILHVVAREESGVWYADVVYRVSAAK